MKTARLIAIDQNPQSTVIYADAAISDGTTEHGLGFTFENGKFDALWDLAQRLTKLGIELDAPTDEVNALLNKLDLNDWESDNN
jgi:hypothetical protein